MIWAILIAVGIPLWFCAMAILLVVLRHRALRRRPGNVPVRILPPGRERWVPGHGVWVHEVFAFRGSPAAWKEGLLWVTDTTSRPAGAAERKRLHQLGERPVVATFELAGGSSMQFAASEEHGDALLGPFAELEAPAAASRDSSPSASRAP